MWLGLRSEMIPSKTKITPALVAEHGLKPDEYQRVLDLIGRETRLVWVHDMCQRVLNFLMEWLGTGYVRQA